MASMRQQSGTWSGAVSSGEQRLVRGDRQRMTSLGLTPPLH
jgi:hypothetical protein